MTGAWKDTLAAGLLAKVLPLSKDDQADVMACLVATWVYYHDHTVGGK